MLDHGVTVRADDTATAMNSSAAATVVRLVRESFRDTHLSTTADCLAAHNPSSDNGIGWNEKPEASTTSSSSGADDDITGGMNARSPRWFAKNVRQVCDGAVGRPCR